MWFHCMVTIFSVSGGEPLINHDILRSPSSTTILLFTISLTLMQSTSSKMNKPVQQQNLPVSPTIQGTPTIDQL